MLLQLGLRVRVLLAELLQDQLLGERPRDAEPEELLEDERLVFGCTHPPLVQVGSLRVLELREKIQNIKYLSSSGKHNTNLQNVSALVVLNGPAKTSQHCSDFFRAEKGEKSIQQHFQLDWHGVESLENQTGNIDDHPRSDSLQPHRSKEASTSSVHSLDHWKGKKCKINVS